MNQLIKAVILLWSLALTVGDETITCLFSGECVLPCRSTYNEVIHWYNNDRNVHSFYKGDNQLAHQDPAYKGRTSLFTDQISKGNISLILRGVTIQDKRRYRCYTSISSDNKEAFVNVNVMAPVQSVDINMTDNEITCTINKVYPKPTISWNIDGDPKENVQEDSQGLISLTSTLTIQPVQNNPTYTCSVSSGDGTHKYKASLTEDKTEIDSGNNVIIHCPDSKGDTEHFKLSLIFNGFSNVLSYDSQASPPDNMQWKDADIQITKEGNILLHNLDSVKHAGIYSCERTTAHSRQIIQTSVQINAGINVFAIGVGVGIGVGVVIAFIIAIVLCMERNKIGMISAGWREHNLLWGVSSVYSRTK